MFKVTLLSMKKLLLLLFSFALFGLWSERNVQSVHASTIASERLYRLYNPNSGEHFYTKVRLEKQQFVALGWQDEGTGWYALKAGQSVELTGWARPINQTNFDSRQIGLACLQFVNQERQQKGLAPLKWN